MKNQIIKKIEIYKLRIPLKEPFTISLGTFYDADLVAVKIITDSGLTGSGEVSPGIFILGSTVDADFELAKTLAGLIIGKDPFALEDRIKDIDSLYSNSGIRSAFDMALYDLASKNAGLPLYKFLGGSKSKKVYTDMTIGINTPENMAASAVKIIKDGFPEIKVKLGGRDPQLDIECIKNIREAVGENVPIKIDANQGWDEVDAKYILDSLSQYNIIYAEQPVKRENISAMTEIKRSSPIPIMADESLCDHKDALNLYKQKATDYFNIKLAKSGGINNALKICAIADAADIKCQVGCFFETRLGLTALYHLVLARENIIFFDMDSALFLSGDPVIGGIKAEGKGVWTLDDEKPGIGAEFDPVFLSEMEKFIVQ